MHALGQPERYRDAALDLPMPYVYPTFAPELLAALSAACVKDRGPQHDLRKFVRDLLHQGIEIFEDGGVSAHIEPVLLAKSRSSSAEQEISLPVDRSILRRLDQLNAYFPYKGRNRRARECVLQAGIKYRIISLA